MAGKPFRQLVDKQGKRCCGVPRWYEVHESVLTLGLICILPRFSGMAGATLHGDAAIPNVCSDCKRIGNSKEVQVAHGCVVGCALADFIFGDE
jgi:hypothetical protein